MLIRHSNLACYSFHVESPHVADVTSVAASAETVSFPLGDFVAVCDEGMMKSAGDTGGNLLEETNKKATNPLLWYSHITQGVFLTL